MLSQTKVAVALCLIAALEIHWSLAPADAQPAELFRVTKGVFTLKVGQSMDLTDRGILLNLRKVDVGRNDEVRAVRFALNGRSFSPPLGGRVDLKRVRATRDFLKDIRSCFLDLVSAAAPRGAPARATFRLLCD